ncbi:11023_t:CDS:2, partial [Acaulospora colombiana]
PPTNNPQKGNDLLLLYIIDYCDKRKFNESAAALRREAGVKPNQKVPVDSPEGLLYDALQSLTQRRFPNAREHGIAPGRAVPGRGFYPQDPSSIPGQPPYSHGLNGMPTGAPGISAMTPLQDPSLQHLQQGRMPGARGPGAPGAPNTQPEGSTSAQPGPQAQQQRMTLPNGHPLPPNATARPGQMHSNSPQNAGNGMTASPQQATTTNLSDIPPMHLADLARQVGAPPTNPHQLPEEMKGEFSPKGDSPPDKKKPRISPQEPGMPLPSTPSLAAAQPPPLGNRLQAGGPPPGGMVMGGTNQPPMPGGPPFTTMHLGNPNQPPNAPPIPIGAQTVVNGQPMPNISGATGPMAAQIQQYNQRNQATLQPDHQQHLKQLQQSTINGYNPRASYIPPPNPGMPTNLTAGAGGTVPSEQVALGTPGSRPQMGPTGPPKGAMLPPPAPNSTMQPTGATNTNGPNSGKGTPVMAARIKEGSSPGGIEGVSPENARPGSRPIPGSTPQAVSAAPTPSNPITGPPLTPGRPSTISAPSPGLMGQPQQLSRPQSQSPSGLSVPRAPTSTPLQPALNPSVIQAQNYQTAGGPLGGLNGVPNPNSSLSAPASLMPVTLGNPSAGLAGPDTSTSDLFGMSLDLQMMNYPDDFGQSMTLDFGLSDDFYSYIDEAATLDSGPGGP